MPQDPLAELLKSSQPKTTSTDSIIQKHADRTGLDPDLVRRVIGQESNGRPTARSFKGANGLMQLMPGTAQRYKVRNVQDPDENVRGGTDYLKDLMSEFKTPDRALAAYNAGEGAMRKHGYDRVRRFSNLPKGDKRRGTASDATTGHYVDNILKGYTGSGYADPLTSLVNSQKNHAQAGPATPKPPKIVLPAAETTPEVEQPITAPGTEPVGALPDWAKGPEKHLASIASNTPPRIVVHPRKPKTLEDNLVLPKGQHNAGANFNPTRMKDESSGPRVSRLNAENQNLPSLTLHGGDEANPQRILTQARQAASVNDASVDKAAKIDRAQVKQIVSEEFKRNPDFAFHSKRNPKDADAQIETEVTRRLEEEKKEREFSANNQPAIDELKQTIKNTLAGEGNGLRSRAARGVESFAANTGVQLGNAISTVTGGYFGNDTRDRGRLLQQAISQLDQEDPEKGWGATIERHLPEAGLEFIKMHGLSKVAGRAALPALGFTSEIDKGLAPAARATAEGAMMDQLFGATGQMKSKLGKAVIGAAAPTAMDVSQGADLKSSLVKNAAFGGLALTERAPKTATAETGEREVRLRGQGARDAMAANRPERVQSDPLSELVNSIHTIDKPKVVKGANPSPPVETIKEAKVVKRQGPKLNVQGPEQPIVKTIDKPRVIKQQGPKRVATETPDRRVATPEEKILADSIVKENRRAKEAELDESTGLQTPSQWKKSSARIDSDPSREVVYFDANNLKQINDKNGHAAGDHYLAHIGRVIREEASKAGISVRQVFRAGGDEFAIDAPKGEGQKLVEAIKPRVGGYKENGIRGGIAGGVGENAKAADKAMYADKTAMKAPAKPAERVTLSADEIVKHINRLNSGQPDETATKMLLGSNRFELREIPIGEVNKTYGRAGMNRVREYKDMNPETQPPIVLDGKGDVVDGKHRLKAAKARGDKTIKAWMPIVDSVKPKLYYHGTGREFDAFSQDAPKTTGGGLNKYGFFFSPDRKVGERYAKDFFGDKGIVKTATLDFKKPLKLTASEFERLQDFVGKIDRGDKLTDVQEVFLEDYLKQAGWKADSGIHPIEWVKSKGFDAIEKEAGRGGAEPEILVFKPEQAKVVKEKASANQKPAPVEIPGKKQTRVAAPVAAGESTSVPKAARKVKAQAEVVAQPKTEVKTSPVEVKWNASKIKGGGQESVDERFGLYRTVSTAAPAPWVLERTDGPREHFKSKQEAIARANEIASAITPAKTAIKEPVKPVDTTVEAKKVPAKSTLSEQDLDQIDSMRGRKMSDADIAKELSDRRGKDYSEDDVASVPKSIVLKAVEKARAREQQRADLQAQGVEYRGSGGPDTQAFIDKLLIKGYELYQGGKVRFSEWAEKMKEAHPEASRTAINDLWSKLQAGKRPLVTPRNGNGTKPATPTVERTTSIKNATTEAERAERGEEPVEVMARRSFGDVFDAGKKLVDDNEINIRSLSEAWAKKGRSLSPEESTALLYDRMKLQNEHRSIQDRLEKAIKAGNTDAVHELEMQRDSVESAIEVNDQASRRTGYEQGLGLAIRKAMIKQDYSLANVIQRAKNATGEGKISEKTRKRLEELSAKYEASLRKISDHEDTIADLEASKTIKKIDFELRRSKRSSTKKQLDDEFASMKADAVALFKAQASASKHISGALGANIDPEGHLTKLIGKMAVNRVRSIGVNAAQVVDDIHTALTAGGWDLEKKDVRDAISGYGDVKESNQAQAAIDLREVKRQLRLISSIEEAMGGTHPAKSGFKHDPASAEVKRLRTELFEAMRKQGLIKEKEPLGPMHHPTEVDLGPKQGPKGNEAQKLAEGIQNQIDEVKRKIADKDLTSKTPQERRLDPASQQLQDQLEQLQEQYKKLKSENPILGPRQSDANKLPAEGPKLSDARKVPMQGPKLTDAPKQGPKPSDANKLPMEGPRLSDARKLKMEGPKLTDAPKQGPTNWLPSAKKRIQARIDELERRIQEGDLAPRKRTTKPLDAEGQALQDEADRLRARLDAEIRSQRPGRFWRDASTARKAWMLTSPKTSLRNVAGNTANQVFAELSRVPSGIADVAVSMATGQRAMSGASLGDTMKSMVHAAIVGGHDAMNIMKHGATKEQLRQMQFPEEINTGAKIVDWPVKFVFRFMSAQDRVFYEGGYKRNLLDRARIQVKNELRSGDLNRSGARARIKDLVDNPTTDMSEAARQDALVLTFNNNNSLSDAISRARSALKPWQSAALDVVLPFDRTPTNIIARIVEGTPLGLGKNAIQIGKAIANKGMTVEEQRQFSNTFGKATTGSMMIFLGWKLAAAGLLTSADDEKHPMALRLGKHYIEVGRLSPVGNLMVLGSSLQKASRLSKSKRTGAYAKQVLSIPFEQPLLRGTTDLGDVIRNPQQGASRFVANQAFTFVPGSSLVRDVAGWTDKHNRKAKTDLSARAVKEQFQKNVPLLRKRLPKR